MVRLGVLVGSFDQPGGSAALGPLLGRIGAAADAAGLDSLWVMDHFVPPSGADTGPMLEGYAALGFLAGRTRSVRLGTLVTAVSYRHPGVLVKHVTALDVLSGGRMYLGIGAAWAESEALGLGVPFPPLAERFERLEETLLIARQMWDGDPAPFDGRHYQLHRPLNVPNSVQRPRPPILVGGGGRRRTLALVARYADACNLFEAPWSPPVAPLLEVLRRHCDDVGRDYAEIERTVYVSASPASAHDAAEFLRTLTRLAGLGVDHVIVGLPDVGWERTVELLAGLRAETAALVPAGRAATSPAGSPVG